MAAEFDENIVRCRKTDEGMVHDDQVVAIEILLDRGLAEFSKSPPIPLKTNPRMKRFVFGRTFYQRGITARMIPGKSF
jgi:hypothetical protein